MILGSICLFIFLFTLYQLSKEDFLFLRKGIQSETVFNTVLLSLPVALVSARLVFVLLHPNIRYLNPFIFFVVPYFPGLSVIGGIIGGWAAILFLTKRKKIPPARLLDIVGLSFLLSFSSGILIQGIFFLFTNKIFALEEIGRSMLGIAFFIFILSYFIKGKWMEGSAASMTVVLYCVLVFVSMSFEILGHTPLSIPSLVATSILLSISVGICIRSEKLISRLQRK